MQRVLLLGRKKRIEECLTLSSDDRCNDAPTYLQYDVENTGKFGRPVSHEVTTQYLQRKPRSTRLATWAPEIHIRGQAFINQQKVHAQGHTIVLFPLCGPKVPIYATPQADRALAKMTKQTQSTQPRFKTSGPRKPTARLFTTTLMLNHKVNIWR